MVSVNTIQPATVFAWFMLVLVLRRIVLIVIFAIAGRGKPLPAGRVPEDRMFKTGPVVVDAAPAVITTDARANKVIGNDAENDTYFLILLFATAAFSDRVNGDCVRTIVYGSIYLFIRIVYALVYILGLQPWRTIFFFLGICCTLACNLDLVITMSRRSN